MHQMQIVQIKVLRYTVAHRGDATYIFISREKKKTVYHAINRKYRAIIPNYRANDKLRIIGR